MHRLQCLIAVSSVLFSLLITLNCFFGRYGLLDTAAVRESVARIEANNAVLENISSSLSAMRNDCASDDFYLLEGRKLSLYTSGDVVVQIDGYSKKGISEEYGNIMVTAQPRNSTLMRILYSITGVVAFFSFIIYSVIGGLDREERKTHYSGQFRTYHSGSR
ncbi:MAG: hypothetical protein SOZ27_04860 [Spirochaetia bacterium]|nr:hypothetical protein [Spirochaetia bacterium]